MVKSILMIALLLFNGEIHYAEHGDFDTQEECIAYANERKEAIASFHAQEMDKVLNINNSVVAISAYCTKPVPNYEVEDGGSILRRGNS